MRGDRPDNWGIDEVQVEFTPHARGSTELVQALIDFIFVYPACAGIDPQLEDLMADVKSLPRMRGDRPSTWTESSPWE